MRTNDAPDFDGIAPFYQAFEYLALGPALEQARFCLLDHLPRCRRALILGDGDGRFTARLLAAQPELNADAVDLSPAMLRLLERRAARGHPTASSRLRTWRHDARAFTPERQPDLIVTHFFLDCLGQAELNALIGRLVPMLPERGLWLISDFRLPRGVLHWPARAYIRLLYLAFRLLTGMQVSSLPDHATALRAAGMTRVEVRRTLFGLLTTELWQRSGLV
jgi:hypothetical protein